MHVPCHSYWWKATATHSFIHDQSGTAVHEWDDLFETEQVLVEQKSLHSGTLH